MQRKFYILFLYSEDYQSGYQLIIAGRGKFVVMLQGEFTTSVLCENNYGRHL